MRRPDRRLVEPLPVELQNGNRVTRDVSATVRNSREGDGNVGIIRSLARLITLPDHDFLRHPSLFPMQRVKGDRQGKGAVPTYEASSRIIRGKAQGQRPHL